MYDKLYLSIIFSIYKAITHVQLIQVKYTIKTQQMCVMCKSVFKKGGLRVNLSLRLTTQGKNPKVMRCVIRFYSHKYGLICTINPI